MLIACELTGGEPLCVKQRWTGRDRFRPWADRRRDEGEDIRRLLGVVLRIVWVEQVRMRVCMVEKRRRRAVSGRRVIVGVLRLRIGMNSIEAGVHGVAIRDGDTWR